MSHPFKKRRILTVGQLIEFLSRLTNRKAPVKMSVKVKEDDYISAVPVSAEFLDKPDVDEPTVHLFGYEEVHYNEEYKPENKEEPLLEKEESHDGKTRGTSKKTVA